MSINLDEVIGLCRICNQSLGESPPPACANCMAPGSKRKTTKKETDPYKKVWNAVEDEEADLLLWNKNGTLFVPTREELAKRHMSTARHQLSKARKLGRCAAGIEAFNEALIQRKLAQTMLDGHRDILYKSR